MQRDVWVKHNHYGTLGISEGAGQPAPSHVPTMENRGRPRNERRRQEVSRGAWGKCNGGCTLEDCINERLIEFEMPRVEQIYQVWHVCAQLKSNKDEGHLR